MRSALITGISGQDGTLLTQFLLEKNYQIVGISRNKPEGRPWGELITAGVKIIVSDVRRDGLIEKLILNENFSEVYHLASFNSVRDSFTNEEAVFDINFFTIRRILNAIKRAHGSETKVFNASSSEIFPIDSASLLNEESFKCPNSPYGESKLLAQEEVITERTQNGLYAVNGILFNHESEYRQERFFSKKATIGLVDVYTAQKEKIYLETLDSYRDWGYGADYVAGMWKSLQGENPSDYVFATGEIHSTREFIEIGLSYLNLNFAVEDIVKVNDQLFTDSRRMTGDSTKAREILNWKHSLTFKELVEHLIERELSNRSLNL
jgi:GDPmannose 4,6-dehydratase